MAKISKQKLLIIERMALVFENIQSKRAKPHYQKYYRQVNSDIMDYLGKHNQITKSAIDNISKKYKIDSNFIIRNMNFVRLQSDIEQALIDGKITSKNAIDMIKYVERTGSTNVRDIAQVNPLFLKTFMKNNKQFVGQINRAAKIQINRVNVEIQKGQSSRILKKWLNIRKRAKTFDDAKAELRSAFRNNVNDVERVLRTEIHATNEQVKISLKSLEGYKFKIWHTEGDKRVRDSHARVNNKKIKVDSYFVVGGAKGQYPGDPAFPVGERVNCRCYLTFTNED